MIDGAVCSHRIIAIFRQHITCSESRVFSFWSARYFVCIYYCTRASTHDLEFNFKYDQKYQTSIKIFRKKTLNWKIKTNILKFRPNIFIFSSFTHILAKIIETFLHFRQIFAFLSTSELRQGIFDPEKLNWSNEVYRNKIESTDPTRMQEGFECFGRVLTFSFSSNESDFFCEREKLSRIIDDRDEIRSSLSKSFDDDSIAMRAQFSDYRSQLSLSFSATMPYLSNDLQVSGSRKHEPNNGNQKTFDTFQLAFNWMHLVAKRNRKHTKERAIFSVALFQTTSNSFIRIVECCACFFPPFRFRIWVVGRAEHTAESL